MGLELDGGDPLVERIQPERGGRGDGHGGPGGGEGSEFGEVAGRGLEDLGLRVLDQGLEPEGETRGDRVKQGDHVDPGEVGRGRVNGSQVERVVRTHVVVLDLDHRVARLTRQLGNFRRKRTNPRR